MGIDVAKDQMNLAEDLKQLLEQFQLYMEVRMLMQSTVQCGYATLDVSILLLLRNNNRYLRLTLS